MGIRAKTFLTIAVAAICLAAALYAISASFLLDGYRRLEERDMADEAERVEASIWNLLDGMAANARDWAFWDDTYAFMQEPGNAYIESNLTPDALENLDLDFIFFIDDSGNLVYGTGLDAGSGGTVAVPPDPADTPSFLRPLLVKGDDHPGEKGIVMLPQGPMLAASQPVLTSSRRGPYRGTLVMMRALDDELIEDMSRINKLSITVRPVEEKDQPSDFREASAGLAGGRAVYVHAMNGDRVAGYTLIKDISAQPALIIRVDKERYIYGQGLSSVHLFAWTLSAAILVFAGLMVFLLEHLVISRLARLDASIEENVRSGDLGRRLPVRGKDEISRLAQTINEMLDKLERSQEDLKDSEERYRGLVERAPDTIYTISLPEGTITSLNPAFEALTGQPREDWIGRRTFAPLIHPDDIEKARYSFRETRKGKTPPPYEVRVLQKGGDYMTGEVISSPLMQGGRVVGEFGIVRNVTRRVLTQDKLVKLNQCFISLGARPLENIQKIIEAGLDILGAEMAEYYRSREGGHPVTALRQGREPAGDNGFESPHISYEVVVENGEKRLTVQEVAGTDRGKTRPGEEHAGGVSLPISLSYPVSREGRTIGRLRFLFEAREEFDQEDIEIAGMLARALSVEEERYKQEEDLRDFVDIASHELRHPITVMKGYALTLRDRKELIDEGTRDVILDIINHGADRLNELVTGLLDISHIERGKFKIKREKLPLEPLISQAMVEMRARGFSNDFSSRIGADIVGCNLDGEKFTQLMVILLDNAVKYSPAYSPIEVEAELTEEGIVVSVLDRGIGVPEEDRENIFERFYQVEEVEHHSTPGMGMGLYIARKIVEAHGGRIWCEPRPGGGSIFRFKIPCGEKDQEGGEP